MSNHSKTVPDVFILESLPDSEHHDGKILAEVLRTAGKNPIYLTVDDSKTFTDGMRIFVASRYRFLHISCHGKTDSVTFKTGEIIDYKEFAGLFKDISINVTRLFFSACDLGNCNLSKEIFNVNRSFYSIAAPCQPITFGNALAIWTSFYIAMFDINSKKMKETDIISTLTSIIRVFNADFHFTRHNTVARKLLHYKLLSSSLKPYRNDRI